MTKRIFVDGMMCQNCVKNVTKALESIDGAADIQVNLEEKTALVTVPETVSNEMIEAAVSEAGYTVSTIENC